MNCCQHKNMSYSLEVATRSQQTDNVVRNTTCLGVFIGQQVCLAASGFILTGQAYQVGLDPSAQGLRERGRQHS